ncbi:MAG: hypothetical protein FJW34_18785 [Acidobacteria bacterium]|nr:hypothetical protein [Acidobacteriota bacterium]
MPRKARWNATLLTAALEGLEQQRREIEKHITEVRKMLGARTAARQTAPAAKPKRVLSAAGRRRIAEAQKRRWALAKAKTSKKGA